MISKTKSLMIISYIFFYQCVQKDQPSGTASLKVWTFKKVFYMRRIKMAPLVFPMFLVNLLWNHLYVYLLKYSPKGEFLMAKEMACRSMLNCWPFIRLNKHLELRSCRSHNNTFSQVFCKLVREHHSVQGAGVVLESFGENNLVHYGETKLPSR